MRNVLRIQKTVIYLYNGKKAKTNPPATTSGLNDKDTLPV